MSKLEKLIKELCPDGVEYKTLGEIGIFYGGLSGKTKDDFKDGNAKFISYMNVYSNLKLNLNTDEKVKIGENENQHTIEYGDVLFTGSSETPDECGISSVLADKTNEKLYLNSFSFGFRFNDKKLFNPEFSKYLFRSDTLRKQIIKTASGVTRFNVSKEKMKKVSIPVPPLPVQEEIVRILDTFTQLTAELTAELTARRRQYEYYRDALLTFDKLNGGGYSRRVKLGEIAELYAGATPKTTNTEYWTNGTIPWMSSGEVNLGQVFKTEKKITQLGYDSCSTKLVPPNTVVVALAGQGKTRGTVAITRIELCTNQSLCSIVPDTSLKSDFLYHYLKGQYQTLRNISSGDGTRGGLNLKTLKDFEIPLPPLDVQERLVRVLDNFDSICSDLKIGLPAEIEARKKQYEFYRDALLTFAESGRIASDSGGGYRYGLIRIVQYVFGYVSLPLSEICHSIASGNSKTKEVNGKYPVYGSTGIIAQTNQATYTKSNILVARVGANAGYTHLAHGEYDVSDNTLIVDVKGEYNLKYIYYQLINEDLHRYAKGGGQPLVTAGQIKKVVLPIPPLAEQKRIAEILDRFDALCNDISQGLPAEIEARRKQYEHYRDKLLAFREKNPA